MNCANARVLQPQKKRRPTTLTKRTHSTKTNTEVEVLLCGTAARSAWAKSSSDMSCGVFVDASVKRGWRSCVIFCLPPLQCHLLVFSPILASDMCDAELESSFTTPPRRTSKSNSLIFHILKSGTVSRECSREKFARRPRCSSKVIWKWSSGELSKLRFEKIA